MTTSQAVPAPASTYEFAAEHDASLSRTALWARQLAFVWAIAAGLTVLSGAFVAAAVQILFGVLFMHAARNLRAIVRTSGRDVEHLVAAANSLARVLRLRIILVCIGLPIAALGFFVRLITAE